MKKLLSIFVVSTLASSTIPSGASILSTYSDKDQKTDTKFQQVAQVNEKIFGVATANDNTTWFGTQSNNAKGSIYQKLSHKESFIKIAELDGLISNLITDKNNNLIVGTRTNWHEGAIYLKAANQSNFKKIAGINGSVWSLNIDDQGTIWAGVEVAKNKSIIYKKATNQNSFSEVFNVSGLILNLVSKNGVVLAGTSEDGHGKVYQKTADSLQFNQIKEFNSAVRGMAIQSNGDVFVSAGNTIYKKLNKSLNFVKVKDLKSDIFTLTIDNNDTLWIGAILNYSKGEIYQKLVNQNSFKQIDQSFAPIYNLIAAKDNSIWAAGTDDDTNQGFIYKSIN